MIDDWICQECKKKRLIEQANIVHHVIEVKEDWSKRLDIDNLVSVCHSCHNKIHG